jgi:hypothetical protein
VCFDLFLQLLSAIFLILRRTERDMFKNVHWSLCKFPLFFSEDNETEVFSTDFLTILRYQTPWKFFQWEPILFHADGQADGQTDMSKLIIAFRNNANAPKTIMTGLLIFYNLQKIHDDFKFLHDPSPLNKWYQVLSLHTSSRFCFVNYILQEMKNCSVWRVSSFIQSSSTSRHRFQKL